MKIRSLTACVLVAMSSLAMAADDKDNKQVTFAAVEGATVVISPSPGQPGVPSRLVTVIEADIVAPKGISSLLITPSMVTSINTRTQNNSAAVSSLPFVQASEEILVSVAVDDALAQPDVVSYDKITRQSNTKQEITQILNEQGARSFNFFLKGVHSGKHHVVVSAAFVNTDRAAPAIFGSATSSASIGRRTLTVTAIPDANAENN